MSALMVELRDHAGMPVHINADRIDAVVAFTEKGSENTEHRIQSLIHLNGGILKLHVIESPDEVLATMHDARTRQTLDKLQESKRQSIAVAAAVRSIMPGGQNDDVLPE